VLAIAAQRREALQRALDELEPADREVIVLRDLEQLDGESAAAVLGLALPAMKSRLHRARLRLAAALAREGAK
jgi:RNA polymerase sigma-70 factor (ECF subfamily)